MMGGKRWWLVSVFYYKSDTEKHYIVHCYSEADILERFHERTAQVYREADEIQKCELGMYEYKALRDYVKVLNKKPLKTDPILISL